jgi:branched-chain amino acid aminotransferase
MILPGVTRDSVLSLAKDHASGAYKLPGLTDNLVVEERGVTMKEIKEQAAQGNLVELFGTGEFTLVSRRNSI